MTSDEDSYSRGARSLLERLKLETELLSMFLIQQYSLQARPLKNLNLVMMMVMIVEVKFQ